MTTSVYSEVQYSNSPNMFMYTCNLISERATEPSHRLQLHLLSSSSSFQRVSLIFHILLGAELVLPDHSHVHIQSRVLLSRERLLYIAFRFDSVLTRPLPCIVSVQTSPLRARAALGPESASDRRPLPGRCGGSSRSS